MFRSYYSLIKPGIIRGNLLTVSAGFFLAAQGKVNFILLLAVLFGSSLLIASACIFNNYLDRDIDKHMERTRQRALVTGSISGKNALIFGTVLGLLGVVVLAVYTNTTTLYVGLFGFLAYVVLYGYYKRLSVHGTLIGTISGAVPPVAGYTAVTDRLDVAAVILFTILVFWQMPHFYAIALYRYKDYKAASIPVMPVKTSLSTTRAHIMFYILGFTIASAMLVPFGGAGYGYLAVALILGLSWFSYGLRDPKRLDYGRWGRQMFLFSLITVSLLCLAISLDSFV